MKRIESTTMLISGFVFAVLLTLGAYFLTVYHIASGLHLTIVVMVLAIAQLLVQLSYFLEVGRGMNSRWKIVLLCFTAFIVFILAAGSIWIMSSLNNRMTPQDMEQYMHSQDSI